MKFWACLTIALMMTAGGNAGPTPAVVTVELKPSASARNRWVTVGDMANLSGGERGAVERIARIEVAEVPPVGQTLAIKAKQIEFRLLLADIPAGTFTLKGANEIIISGARDPITPEMVEKVAREALLRRLPWPAEDLSINLLRPVVLKLPQVADWETPTIRAEPHGNTAGIGRSQIDVTIFINGERRLSLPVCFETNLLQKVAVCRAALKKGETITAEKVYADRRPFDAGNRTVIPYDAVLGRKLLREMLPGQLISSFDVEAETQSENSVVIQPRQSVKILARLGSVNIVATGEAMQEGRVGQIIRVQNLDSKKIVPGRVTGPGTVEVETGGNP